jgi:hypothetical protein
LSLVVARVMRADLIQNGIDEPVLDREVLADPRLPVVDLERRPDRLLRGTTSSAEPFM